MFDFYIFYQGFIRMFLTQEKFSIFLAVCGLLIYSQTAAAQHVVPGVAEVDSVNESYSTKSLIEESAAPDSFAPNVTGKSDDSGVDEKGIEFSAADYRAKSADFKYRFRAVEINRRNFNFDGAAKSDSTANYPARKNDDEPRYVRETERGRGFNYGGAIKQSLMFLSVQHGYAILGQAKTRRALKHGAFFRDYASSVKSLRGWDDGGKFFTNYIAHPMQGALTGHLYVQNSPQALREQFSMSGKYWKTRTKAMLWTTAWSVQFEIGPVSQSSIGNVGLSGKQAWVDVVVTPTMGTAMLIGEDALDHYIVKYIERRNNNFYVKVLTRMLFNPTRNFSNLLRFKEPWYRDRPTAR